MQYSEKLEVSPATQAGKCLQRVTDFWKASLCLMEPKLKSFSDRLDEATVLDKVELVSSLSSGSALQHDLIDSIRTILQPGKTTQQHMRPTNVLISSTVWDAHRQYGTHPLTVSQ
eukprot:1252291-Amphidinium_carterae.1